MPKVVEALLDSGADPAAESGEECTVLHYLVQVFILFGSSFLVLCLVFLGSYIILFRFCISLGLFFCFTSSLGLVFCFFSYFFSFQLNYVPCSFSHCYDHFSESIA